MGSSNSGGQPYLTHASLRHFFSSSFAPSFPSSPLLRLSQNTSSSHSLRYSQVSLLSACPLQTPNSHLPPIIASYVLIFYLEEEDTSHFTCLKSWAEVSSSRKKESYQSNLRIIAIQYASLYDQESNRRRRLMVAAVSRTCSNQKYRIS